MSNNFKKRNEIAAKIIANAWKHPHFKEKLMKNPRAAFKEMGLDIPEGIHIKVIEDKPDSFTFVLPPSAVQNREMSDQELEKLAAGCLYFSELKMADYSCTVGCAS